MEEIGQVVVTLNLRDWMWYVALGYMVVMLPLTAFDIYLRRVELKLLTKKEE